MTRLLPILAAAALLAWLWRRRVEPRDESRCDRCGGPNPASWHAPSPLWNAVMRADGAERYGFCCPTCFVELSNERVTTGKAGASWCVRIHDDIGLPTVFGDGRTWDADRCMWVDDPMSDVQGADPVTVGRASIVVESHPDHEQGPRAVFRDPSVEHPGVGSDLNWWSCDGSTYHCRVCHDRIHVSHHTTGYDPTYIEAREVAIRRGGQSSERSLEGT